MQHWCGDFSRFAQRGPRWMETATLPSLRHSWPIFTTSPLCVYVNLLLLGFFGDIFIFQSEKTPLVATPLPPFLLPTLHSVYCNPLERSAPLVLSLSLSPSEIYLDLSVQRLSGVRPICRDNMKLLKWKICTRHISPRILSFFSREGFFTFITRKRNFEDSCKLPGMKKRTRFSWKVRDWSHYVFLDSFAFLKISQYSSFSHRNEILKTSKNSE